MKFLSQLLAAMLLWTFIACNNKNAAKDLVLENVNKEVVDKANDFKSGTAAADTVAPSQNATNGKQLASTNVTHEDWDKKIIKTGNLEVEVTKYSAFNDLIHESVKKLGGYIAQEEQTQSPYRMGNVVTIKVPVDQFDNAVLLLTPASEKIIEKKISSEDVTTELVDTKSRMEAKKHVRDRYIDLLKQAKNMEEVLQVQNEINGIQEDIESAAGRINYLGHAAAYSTIHLNFYQVLSTVVETNPAPSFGHRVVESFKNGALWMGELSIALVSLWPLWTGIVVAWLLIRRKISFVRKQKPVA